MDAREKDAEYLASPGSERSLEVVDARDSFFFDRDNSAYIDFLAGSNVGHLGWSAQIIRDAVLRTRQPAYVPPDSIYEPWTDLAALLAEIAPGELRKSFRATGGSEAVDLALQVAMLFTGRGKFVSIAGAYHGNSLAGISIGDAEKAGRLPARLPCGGVAPPLDDRAADEVERLLAAGDVAAFVMEPVAMNLGVLVPEQGFMVRVREACTQHGTLLIFDEVACGFGRTGKLFASEHFGIEPDVMCLGKAITGGYAGMGATITTGEIADAVADRVSAYSTYGWHPLGTEAALANIRYMRANLRDLMAMVDDASTYFATRLHDMPWESPAEVRILGLAIAVAFEDPGYATRLVERCREERLLVSTEAGALVMSPALNMHPEVAREGLDVLERVVALEPAGTRG